MKIDFELIDDPKLQFGEYFEYEDAKTGLAEFGPFGKNIAGLHKRDIKIGIIGTGESITKVQDWLDRCSRYIESQNIKVKRVGEKFNKNSLFFDDRSLLPPEYFRMSKILNRDFPGFNIDTSFESRFQLNPRWERRLELRELSSILGYPEKRKRISRLVEFILNKLASISENSPTPDIVIIAITTEIEENADTVQVSGNYYLNLRHALKAGAMQLRNAIPIQLIRASTLDGDGKRRELQEVATRAWNFCVAQYYKAEGIPWRPLTLDQDTCYVGVSFYVAQEKDTTLSMRSSIALAFDFLGQGLILRGDEFEWDKKAHGRSPHLTKEGATSLIKSTLKEFTSLRGIPPKRVVIHKSSEFWGADRDQHNEVDGFFEGIDSVYRGIEVDLVSLRQTGIRLFREGNYPPLRGMYFTLENKERFLYTMGYIPYLETYPKTYVPEPWHLAQHIGGSSPKQLFREVLALTKMNMNNCSYADGTPITLSFAKKIGEIMKHVSIDGRLLPQYRFYM